MSSKPGTATIPRIPITKVWPEVDGGRFKAKAFLGEVIEFGAISFREGHDRIAVELVISSPSGQVSIYPMKPGRPGLDEWSVLVQISELGDHYFHVQAWADEYQTWLHNTEVKLRAEVDQELMMLEGAKLLKTLAENSSDKKDANSLLALAETLLDKAPSPHARLEAALLEGMTQIATRNPLRNLLSSSETRIVRSEVRLAGVGQWYEFFPRSEGAKRGKDGVWKSGTFKTATKRLAAVAEMGFNVLYLPPIHPIGESHRKGPNNTLNATPQDPGSPWAIGSSAGGHDTIHPDLGTEKDFAAFVKSAGKLGISVAMDLALQASPDHPWVKSHPEWFTMRADGSIAYAENPPKKYQDIYPINFDNDPEGIYREVHRIVSKWIGLGVKIFRVDNPHTKPVAFWQRLIAQIETEHEGVIFLAEAFTRPAMMHALGKAGFQQSYTYFTWRNQKQELADYLREVSEQTINFFRPNFWVNTPDILTEYLQFGGRPAFKIRATVAATSCSLWGMYAGFELYEAVARPGAEENIDSEKYEYKDRDWDLAEKSGNTLAPFVTKLNEIRNQHPALQQQRNLRLHWTDDSAIIAYSKHLPGEFSPSGRPNTILTIVNLDPHSVRETMVHLDLPALGIEPGATFRVRDLLTNSVFEWGEHNFVRLDAFSEPAHILEVEHR